MLLQNTLANSLGNQRSVLPTFVALKFGECCSENNTNNSLAVIRNHSREDYWLTKHLAFEET